MELHDLSPRVDGARVAGLAVVTVPARPPPQRPHDRAQLRLGDRRLEERARLGERELHLLHEKS